MRGSSSRAGRTAVCGLCGAAGCDSGCNSNMCGYLLAPPGARCIPRGPTYYFGWHIGFTPLKPLDGSGKVHDGGYWKQLYKMLVWHTMMWAFGLMILLLIIAARQPIVVANVPQYAQVGPRGVRGVRGWWCSCGTHENMHACGGVYQHTMTGPAAVCRMFVGFCAT